MFSCIPKTPDILYGEKVVERPNENNGCVLALQNKIERWQ